MRAIVVGAGISGLSLAYVLSHSFDEVEVIEPHLDSIGTRARPGNIQGAHLHVLVRRGQRILFDLFPDIKNEIKEVHENVVTPLNELEIDGIKVVVDIVPQGDLKKLVDDMKNGNDKVATLLLQEKDGKVQNEKNKDSIKNRLLAKKQFTLDTLN